MNKDFVMMFEEFDNSLYEEDVNQETPANPPADPPAEDGTPTNQPGANSAIDVQQIESNYKKTINELRPLIVAKYPKANVGRVIDRIRAAVAKIYVTMEMQNTNQTRAAAVAVKETMRQNQSHMPFLTVQHIVDIAKYTYTGLGSNVFPDRNRTRYLRNPEYLKALNYIEQNPSIINTIQ